MPAQNVMTSGMDVNGFASHDSHVSTFGGAAAPLSGESDLAGDAEAFIGPQAPCFDPTLPGFDTGIDDLLWFG